MSWICAFWSGHVGGAAGYRCIVLLQGATVRIVRVVCALWSWPAGEMSMAVWALGPDGDYIYAVSKRESVWLLPKNIFCYLGFMLT